METNTPEVEVETPRIWYLAGPYFRYVENVKKLAKAHNLKIVDANVTEGRNFAVEGPAVTFKPEYAASATPAPSFAEVIAAQAKKEEAAKATAAPAALLGSDKLPAEIEVGSGQPDVQLDTVVAAAHTRSGLDVVAWNKLSAAKRGKALMAELEIMRGDAALALAKTLTP